MFFHFLKAFLDRKSYDIDMLGFSAFLHASSIDFNTAGTKARFVRSLHSLKSLDFYEDGEEYVERKLFFRSFTLC